MPFDAETSLQRIHDRIDSIAKDVHTLQLTTVKRDGPIVDEIRHNTRQLDRMKDNLLTKEEFRNAMEAEEYRTFSNRDKLIGMWIAALVLLTEVINTIYFITR